MLKFEKPAINDYENINIIARKVHEQHIQYRANIFKSGDNPIDNERFSLLVENNEILIAKIEDKIVGYTIDQHGFCYRKVFFIEMLT